MASEVINENNLPSKTYYEELERIMNYNEINDIIINNVLASKADNWMMQFHKYASDYLSKYMNADSNINADKRCRDFIYMMVDIIRSIHSSSASTSYELIESNITTFTSTMQMYGYEKCYMFSSDQYSNAEDKKNFDDFLENITYINRKLNDVNNSQYCTELEQYVQEYKEVYKQLYTSNQNLYSEIAKYYGLSSVDGYEKMIPQITCTSVENDEASAVDGGPGEGTKLSGGSISTISISSLLGISILSYFLYNVTPIGPRVNTLIKKKLNFMHEYNDKDTEDLLEYSKMYPTDIQYQMSYEPS
ncbi:PIR Superfamily Protein [Plasmodium ovale wallikeri]|uniref:PIR Superfamily Protein n=1 Tax=Plasmodium ovale wallikeri TaxID=864142 RepID=A0A1A9AL45_PLAOA|nr:PIR Superfamily Protein [Plasmodium ovale wallikeri]SBT56914.1 PIR Superfamily Protein [Plasmodium ovale wallikeri]